MRKPPGRGNSRGQDSEPPGTDDVERLFAEIARAPQWPPPEPETTDDIRGRLEEWLRQAIKDAEAELVELRLPADTWHLVTAYLTDTMPNFGSGDLADQLLGPMAPKSNRSRIPTRGLQMLAQIERQVKRCQQCRVAVESASSGSVERAMIAQAQRHHKTLHRRYLAELAKPIPAVFQEMPAWAAAFKAATGHAALEKLDSPMAIFAAGRYLERQSMIDYLLRALRGENRRAARAAAARYEESDRRARRDYGRRKAGKISPHTALIQATVRELKRRDEPVSADAVLAILTGENSESDYLSDIAREVEPIILPDSEPPVEIDADDGRICFRFKNRDERSISYSTLKNIVSEAARKNS